MCPRPTAVARRLRAGCGSGGWLRVCRGRARSASPPDPVGGPDFADLTVALVDGELDANTTLLPVFDVLGKHLTVSGYELFELTTDPARRAEAARSVSAGLRSGDLKPLISRTFDFDGIVAAHEYLESNQPTGKIIIRVG